MANTTVLKRRIGSVKNTRQITNAMELVSASKMRRAVSRAASGRVYREYAYSLLSRLSTVTEVQDHPLLVKRPVKTILYILLTSNSGLAGAYNSNTIRILLKQISENQKAKIKSQVLTIGKKGGQFVRNLNDVELVAAYNEVGDGPDANDIRPILNTAIMLYTELKVDSIKIIYTNFVSSIVQDAKVLDLLPASFEVAKSTNSQSTLSSCTFEPSITAVLDNITERLLEVQLYQAYLEAKASEESMRMMAMKNATDNASELIADLALEFNKARQAAITQELAEITGGAEATNI